MSLQIPVPAGTSPAGQLGFQLNGLPKGSNETCDKGELLVGNMFLTLEPNMPGIGRRPPALGRTVSHLQQGRELRGGRPRRQRRPLAQRRRLLYPSSCGAVHRRDHHHHALNVITTTSLSSPAASTIIPHHPSPSNLVADGFYLSLARVSYMPLARFASTHEVHTSWRRIWLHIKRWSRACDVL